MLPYDSRTQKRNLIFFLAKVSHSNHRMLKCWLCQQEENA